ncbi:MAG: HDOD domain-containing protein [Gammaproteobacteria bacterium]|nr:HDOD domain-containing protein [Gammaproteobacteria bacterium]
MTNTSTEFDPSQVEKALKGITIPPRPRALLAVQEEMRKDSPELREIAHIVSQDIGISSGIIKTVNSPFLGLRNKVTSIEQAVMLLGIKHVVNIVGSMGLKNAIGKIDGFDTDYFWDNASDIAVISAEISKQLDNCEADAAYTLGLFKDAALPLLVQKHQHAYPKAMGAAYQNQKRSITDIESEYFEINHAMIGYHIALNWHLPENICDAIRDHHDLAILTNPDKLTPLLAVLKLAESIANPGIQLNWTEEDHEWPQIARAIFEYTGLSEPDYQDMKDFAQEYLLSRECSTH